MFIELDNYLTEIIHEMLCFVKGLCMLRMSVALAFPIGGCTGRGQQIRCTGECEILIDWRVPVLCRRPVGEGKVLGVSHADLTFSSSPCRIRPDPHRFGGEKVLRTGHARGFCLG
jgi:hypothetical protein